MSSKYSALPDLDQSQDIYETPDLASDVSTVQTTVAGDDDNASDTSQIDHTHLPRSTAAKKFRHANIDASNVDFSDRITGKRKSYVASSRRRRGTTGSDDDDDDDWEEEESVEQRLARLRREVEELRGQLREKKKEEDEEVVKGVGELAEALEGLVTTEGGAQGRLAKRMAASLGVVGQIKREVPGALVEGKGEAMIPKDVDEGSTTTYTITYAPAYKKAHTLGKVAEFDQRLSVLEKVLGMSTSALADFEQQLPANAMIPHLDELSRQMAVLNSSTTSSLDSASRRVKQLASDTEKLAEARKAAKKAATDGADPMENDETIAKINALYGMLPTIEGMKPLLPALLDRLRSLRAIHQDAARASEALGEVETKQEEMAIEIAKWEEALVKVEGVMQKTQGTIQGNMAKVEGWVREIERKTEAVI